MTDRRAGADADDDRLRDRRLAGPDRRRVHVRQRPPLRRRRRPRTSSERGEQAKGVVIAYDRRFASEHFAAAAAEVAPRPRHPGRLRRPRGPDPDELVRGRRAGRRRRHRHHRQPQPVDRQRVQGQGPDRLGRRAPTCSRAIEARLAVNGGRADRPPAVRRRRGGRAWSSASTRSTATSAFVRRTVDLDALRAADLSHPRRPAVWRRVRAGSRGCSAGGRIRVDEIHQERNPYFGGVNPEPIRPNVDEALGARSPAAATTWACCSTATPTGPARPTSRARSSTSSRSPACSCTTWPSTAAGATRSSVSVNNTSMADAPRRALRHRDPRDPGRVQVHRPEDDRDRAR